MDMQNYLILNNHFVPQMCQMKKGLVGIPAFFQTEHTESTLTDVA